MPGKLLLEGAWKTTTTRECRTETRRLQQRECRTEILPQSATNRGGRRTKYMEIVKSGQKLSWEQNVTFSLDDYRVALQMCSKDRSYCAGDDMKRRWWWSVLLGEIRTRRGGRRGTNKSDKSVWRWRFARWVETTLCFIRSDTNNRGSGVHMTNYDFCYVRQKAKEVKK